MENILNDAWVFYLFAYMFKSGFLNNGSEQIPYSKTASPLADPNWFGIVEIIAVDCCSR